MTPRRAQILLLLAGLLGGCHRGGMRFPGPLDDMRYAVDRPPPRSAEVAPRTRPPRGSTAGPGAVIAAQAAALVDATALEVDGERYRYDCSGMVIAAYAGAGQLLRGGSRDLYALAEAEGVLHTRPLPQPGDVAFFDNTYDRNGNRKRDDELTHVGIVESIDAEGTVTVVHLGSGGVGRLRMNLSRPDDPAVNSPLRAMSGRDGGPVLAGELWRGFGSLWALRDAAERG